jgi:hypothetical protein
MRFVLISLTLILLNFQSIGQDKFSFDWNGKSFIDTLKSNGVDTVCTLKSLCTSPWTIPENDTDSICRNKDWRYFELFVFWKQKGKDYYKKFNNCFEFETKQLDSIGFINYFIDNQAELLKEKVESATGIEINNGDTTFILYDVDHYCELDTKLEISGEKFQNEFYDYNFDTALNELYGDRNKKLKLFRLYNLMNEEKDFIERKYKPKILR